MKTGHCLSLKIICPRRKIKASPREESGMKRNVVSINSFSLYPVCKISFNNLWERRIRRLILQIKSAASIKIKRQPKLAALLSFHIYGTVILLH